MTAPYYEDDLVTLYHGDCREVIEWLEADVLVMDPPYGSQFTAENPKGGYGRRQNAAGTSKHASTRPGAAEGGFTIANDGGTEFRDEVLALWERERAHGRGGPALVFGSPRMADPPGDWSDRLVWDKKRPGMNGGPWRYRHESIFVSSGFVRADNSAVSIIAAWPDQTDHIHAKPLALMLRLVAAAPPGVIADPTTGSGSTLAAAKQLGHRAIGVELDERYCEIAARRLASRHVVRRGDRMTTTTRLRLDLLVRTYPEGDRWTWRLWSGRQEVSSSGSQLFSRRVDCARGAEVGAGLAGVREALLGFRGEGVLLWPAWRWVTATESADVEIAYVQITIIDARTVGES